MKTKLLIYIPVYNAENRIRRTLECLVSALENCDAKAVRVHISDNASTDDTLNICAEFFDKFKDICQFSLVSNQHNIGATRNIFKGLVADWGQEKTWIIGDDDLILPWAIKNLLHFIDEIEKNGCRIKFIHVNALLVSPTSYVDSGLFDLIKSKKMAGSLMNKKCTSPVIVSFKDLIDPMVDDSILGAAFCCIFDSHLVREAAAKISYPSDFSGSGDDKYTSKYWFPHSYAFSRSFSARDFSFVSPMVSVVATVGHQAYWDRRDFVIGCAALDNLFEFFESGVINENELDFYLRNFFLRHQEVFSRLLKNNHIRFSEKKMEKLLRACAWLLDVRTGAHPLASRASHTTSC